MPAIVSMPDSPGNSGYTEDPAKPDNTADTEKPAANPEKPGNSQSPATGDGENPLLWILLVFASGAALSAAVFQKEKDCI